ncbi:MAG: outer membrane beta-barrel protein [Bacteroidota bacterium]
MKVHGTILFACLCLLSFSLGAQPQKGNALLAGSLEIYGKNGNQDIPTSGVSVNPSVGVFVTDHLLVGMQMGVHYDQATFPNTLNKNWTLIMAPRVTYYFGNGPWQPFLSTLVGVTHGAQQFFPDNQPEIRIVQNNLMYDVEAGVAYWLTEKLSADGYLRYTSQVNIHDVSLVTSRSLNGGVRFSFLWSR